MLERLRQQLKRGSEYYTFQVGAVSPGGGPISSLIVGQYPARPAIEQTHPEHLTHNRHRVAPCVRMRSFSRAFTFIRRAVSDVMISTPPNRAPRADAARHGSMSRRPHGASMLPGEPPCRHCEMRCHVVRALDIVNVAVIPWRSSRASVVGVNSRRHQIRSSRDRLLDAELKKYSRGVFIGSARAG